MNLRPLVSKAFFTRSEGAEILGRVERHISEKLQHDFANASAVDDVEENA